MSRQLDMGLFLFGFAVVAQSAEKLADLRESALVGMRVDESALSDGFLESEDLLDLGEFVAVLFERFGEKFLVFVRFESGREGKVFGLVAPHVSREETQENVISCGGQSCDCGVV